MDVYASRKKDIIDAINALEDAKRQAFGNSQKEIKFND
jgi:hypothetical protein